MHSEHQYQELEKENIKLKNKLIRLATNTIYRLQDIDVQNDIIDDLDNYYTKNLLIIEDDYIIISVIKNVLADYYSQNQLNSKLNSLDSYN